MRIRNLWLCALVLLLLPGGPAGAGTQADLPIRAHIPLAQAIWPLHEVLAQDYQAREYTFLNPPGSLAASLSGDCRRSRRAGLRIDYAFSGPGNGGWVATWEHSPTLHFDASHYGTLILWAKGNAPNGFQIGLKDTAEREGKVETRLRVSISPTEWRRIAVPLSAFVADTGPIDLAHIRNLNVGLNASHGAGGLCIDNISFGGPLDEVYLNDDGGREFHWREGTGTLTYDYTSACRRNYDVGLQVDFGFSGNGHGGWGVHWDHASFGHFDASTFAKLSLWVKGSAPDGFHIGLKDTTGYEVKAEARDYVTVSASEWRKVSVPLSAFTQAQRLADAAFVQNINVGFNAGHGTGSICIADVAFE